MWSIARQDEWHDCLEVVCHRGYMVTRSHCSVWVTLLLFDLVNWMVMRPQQCGKDPLTAHTNSVLDSATPVHLQTGTLSCLIHVSPPPAFPTVRTVVSNSNDIMDPTAFPKRAVFTKNYLRNVLLETVFFKAKFTLFLLINLYVLSLFVLIYLYAFYIMGIDSWITVIGVVVIALLQWCSSECLQQRRDERLSQCDGGDSGERGARSGFLFTYYTRIPHTHTHTMHASTH